MIIRNVLDHLKSDFNSGKVIVVTGARQVGKTTLVRQLAADMQNVLTLNCDDADDRLALEGKTSTELKSLTEGYQLVFIDEAQRVKDIGLVVKMIADMHLPAQVIVTGSSSLELADGIYEPATGRHVDYQLFPFSISELVHNTSERDERRMLETRLVYGLYPDVVMRPGDARRTLVTLSNDYLYKDLLSYKGIRKADVLQKLLRALALQIGHQVSYSELSNLLGIDKITVEHYIGLLEKCFVIFRLDSYSRNLRNEIKKGKKIYFYDNGIRNAVISNFAPLEARNDVGELWENMMVSERVKRNVYGQTYTQMFYWRTHEQNEIDLVEEADGKLNAFEFKWNDRKQPHIPASFAKNYTYDGFTVITPQNYMKFI